MIPSVILSPSPAPCSHSFRSLARLVTRTQALRPPAPTTPQRRHVHLGDGAVVSRARDADAHVDVARETCTATARRVDALGRGSGARGRSGDAAGVSPVVSALSAVVSTGFGADSGGDGGAAAGCEPVSLSSVSSGGSGAGCRRSEQTYRAPPRHVFRDGRGDLRRPRPTRPPPRARPGSPRPGARHPGRSPSLPSRARAPRRRARTRRRSRISYPIRSVRSSHPLFICATRTVAFYS